MEAFLLLLQQGMFEIMIKVTMPHLQAYIQFVKSEEIIFLPCLNFCPPMTKVDLR